MTSIRRVALFWVCCVGCAPAREPSRASSPEPVPAESRPSASPVASATIETSRAQAKPVALLIGAQAPKRDVLAARALERARALGFDARDYRKEFERWRGSSLFYGGVGDPPPWVPEAVAEVWRKEGAACPKKPAHLSDAASEKQADEAYACTQKLLIELREMDLKQHDAAIIFEVDVGEQTRSVKPTGEWFAGAHLGHPGDWCGHSLGAGAQSPLLVALRDAETPHDEECAMETALALLERLFRGEPGEVEGRASISLRVVPSPCPLAQLHVDVAERERAKTPQHVCF